MIYELLVTRTDHKLSPTTILCINAVQWEEWYQQGTSQECMPQTQQEKRYLLFHIWFVRKVRRKLSSQGLLAWGAPIGVRAVWLSNTCWIRQLLCRPPKRINGWHMVKPLHRDSDNSIVSKYEQDHWVWSGHRETQLWSCDSESERWALKNSFVRACFGIEGSPLWTRVNHHHHGLTECNERPTRNERSLRTFQVRHVR